jgi:hypothetical protein
MRPWITHRAGVYCDRSTGTSSSPAVSRTRWNCSMASSSLPASAFSTPSAIRAAVALSAGRSGGWAKPGGVGPPANRTTTSIGKRSRLVTMSSPRTRLS